MKRILYFKLLGAYLLFAVLAMIQLGTLTQKLTDEYLIEDCAKKLYVKATSMASDFDEIINSNISPAEVQHEVEEASHYYGARIWICDINGNLLLDSSSSAIMAMAEANKPKSIEGFNVADFGSNYYQTGNFYASFKEDTLTIFSPITSNYKVQGYVLFHKPIAEALEQSTAIVNIASTSVAVVFMCSFILLLAFTFVVYKPIQKITNAAEKYAKGDFSEKINVHSNDEIGYLANTLNYMSTELDTLEEEQRKFISNVSHDFRSPLTSIKGYIEAILDGTIPVEMQEKYLNIILFETDRLNKLTQKILDLNRFGNHGMNLDITDFDINHMIRTTIMTFEGTCSKKNLRFNLLFTEQRLYVKGDMSKIQQVIYNLIDNATKFSHNNTSITIETSVRNEKVLISVKDSGIGIPSDSIKRIWERFYKTDLSRGKDKKGTGLGLAIVKEIIQAHNQNINVISTEGVGTEFIFTLPLSEKE